MVDEPQHCYDPRQAIQQDVVDTLGCVAVAAEGLGAAGD